MPVEKRELEDPSVIEEQKAIEKFVRTEMDQSRPSIPIDEMGEFEDPYEDDIEEDGADEVVIAPDTDSEQEAEMEQDEDEAEPEKLDVYLPGQTLGEDEVLVADNSAYEMLHTMNVEWPSLSFDVLRDHLGSGRDKLPATMYLVSGSQAQEARDNRIYIMKMSNLHRTKNDDDEMDEDSDDDEDLDENPILEHKSVPHYGGINRIRAMPSMDSHVVATWSEMGKIHIWDLSAHVAALDAPGMTVPKEVKPLYTNHKHNKREGFAMDWSPTVAGRLLTGDMNKRIYYTHRTNNGFETDDQPFLGHTDSVEDIQWSPSEQSVFASSSVDRTIKIWDLRAKKKPQLSIMAHDSDVNVISWNRYGIIPLLPRFMNASVAKNHAHLVFAIFNILVL
jgi:ribosome assembly protein RRB1